MKKVITGHDGQGKSVFFKVESETVTVGSPILDWHEIWATHADDKIPVCLLYTSPSPRDTA